MRVIFLLLMAGICMTSGLPALAQRPGIPQVAHFSSREAYQAGAVAALDISTALFAIPPKEDAAWRQDAAVFLRRWLEGNPMVKVPGSSMIRQLDTRNPGISLLYEAGCIRHTLNSRETVNPQHRIAVVLGWIMRYYEEQPGIRRDKNMKAMIRARDEGRLDQWIEQEMGVED